MNHYIMYWLRYFNFLNMVINGVFVLQHVVDPYSYSNIVNKTDDIAIINNIISMFHVFIISLSYSTLKSSMKNEDVLYLNRYFIIFYLVLCASNLYLHTQSLLQSWANMMLNITMIIFYVIPYIKKSQISRQPSFTLGIDQDDF